MLVEVDTMVEVLVVVLLVVMVEVPLDRWGLMALTPPIIAAATRIPATAITSSFPVPFIRLIPISTGFQLFSVRYW